MSLVVAVAVPDGVAIASDGRTVAGMGSGGPPQVVSDTQQKIVMLGDRVAAIIPEPYIIFDGTPFNLRSALEQIRLDIDQRGTVDDLLKELPGRVKGLLPVLQEQQALDLLFLKLVGLRDDKTIGMAMLDGLSVSDEGMHSTVEPGLNWFGDGDVVSRIVLGRPAARPPDVDGPIVQYHIPTALMSLSDATALAEQLVSVTTTIARNVIAIEHDDQQLPFILPVGGHLHSATVTRNGFRWVREPLMLEHRETHEDRF